MKLNIIQTTNIFDGLFSYLFKDYSAEEVVMIVNASASSTFPSRGSPIVTLNPYIKKNIVEDFWASDNIKNSSFSIKFHYHIFALHSYTIQSRDYQDYNTPLEWVLEATNDDIHWDLIHHKVRGNELNGRGLSLNWQSNNKNEYYKHYRFTQIGENYHFHEYEKYIFGIGSIEMFGILIDFIYTPTKYIQIRISNCFIFLALL